MIFRPYSRVSVCGLLAVIGSRSRGRAVQFQTAAMRRYTTKMCDFPKSQTLHQCKVLAEWGLRNLLDQLRAMQRST